MRNTCVCVLGPWPWPREGLSLAGPTRGGFSGFIVPGPGAGGARKSLGPRAKFFWCFLFGLHLILGKKMGPNFSEDLFFCVWSSPDFGQKMGLNFSEDLFFLVIFGRDFGARHRPSYPLETFLSETLVLGLGLEIFFGSLALASSLVSSASPLVSTAIFNCLT